VGRVIRPEILDDLPLEDARRSLDDLVRLNRQWGGHSTLRWLLAQAIASDRETFSLLDVGAASGDMGECVRRWYPGATVTSLDYRASHLEPCAPPKVVADAFGLPFRGASFDYVFCSLFLHHFTNPQVVDLLRGFGAVARRAVLVIDLERHMIARNFVPWTRWLFGWDRVTVHDAVASVEAAFRPPELEALARSAGLRDVRTRRFRPAFRIAMLARPAQ
jgi:ubiquinone/menaquinone biosynthesis C-methylase UbiE